MVALVTGASSGIGEATARHLAPTHELVLVARREDRLQALARELGRAHVIAADLTDPDVPERIAREVEERHGRLDLLVNNAGAAWRGHFYEQGVDVLLRHMTLNFEAPVRLTHALLPLLRRSAPSAIVNVSSTSGRIARPNSGAYSASKFALIGWSDALYLEEREHGVHVGLVLPGFITTPGFPQRELHEGRLTRLIISTPDKVAEAIADAAGGKAERYVPRYYGLFAGLRVVAPGLIRRVLAGGAMTPSTAGDSAR